MYPTKIPKKTYRFHLRNYFSVLGLALKGLIIDEKIVDPRYKKVYEYRGVILKPAVPRVIQFLEAVNASDKYKRWVDQFFERGEMDLKEVYLTDCDFLGPTDPEWLHFFKGFVTVYKAGTQIQIRNNIAFCSGECDACLIICTVNLDGEVRRFVPLVERYQCPTGGKRVEALYTSRMYGDEESDSKWYMAKELEMLVRIPILPESINPLPGKKTWSMPSLSDESFDMWYLETEIEEKRYKKWCIPKPEIEEAETVMVRFYDYDTIEETLNEIGDLKAGEMWRRYKWMKAKEATA